jgi:hypothetical protein
MVLTIRGSIPNPLIVSYIEQQRGLPEPGAVRGLDVHRRVNLGDFIVRWRSRAKNVMLMLA